MNEDYCVIASVHKLVCPTYSEANQYRNVGVWSRERLIAGPSQRLVAYAQTLPPTPQRVSGKHF